MLKQKLQQKLLQKLSPQQIQMIKLLEIPTLQIEQRIKKELEENPALEEGPEEEEDITGMDADDELYEDNDKDQEEFTLDDYIEASCKQLQQGRREKKRNTVFGRINFPGTP